MKIFVGGLPKDISDSELSDAFSDFGTVSSAKVVTDKKTGMSRSYGFVEMPDQEQAKRAIEALHEAVVDGATVSVKEGVEPEPVKPKFSKGPKAFKKPIKKTYKTVAPQPQRAGGRRRRNGGYNPGNVEANTD